MATINSHEASPSTSPRSSVAYLTFRGEDTRHGITDDRFHALMRPKLLKAIEGSRVSMTVLSKNYASLEELVMILKCRASRHSVIPVFYDVDPSEVRKQSGSFKEAFMRHERRIETEMGEQKEYLMGRVQEWRMALKEVANLAGFIIEA